MRAEFFGVATIVALAAFVLGLMMCDTRAAEITQVLVAGFR
jgi:hypothetical protein